MERRYQGRWDSAMVVDYVWGLVRAVESKKYKIYNNEIEISNDEIELKTL